MNGHECYIIGAGDFFGLRETPDDSDYVIAADAGYEYCTENCIIPDLVLGDFDSLGKAPKHPNVMQLPVEKDDTDTMFALKLGLERAISASMSTARSAASGRITRLRICRDSCIF